MDVQEWCIISYMEPVTGKRVEEAVMLKSIEGTYSNGRIELSEVPRDISDDTRVIVTFLERGAMDLRQHGIGREQAADLRHRLSTFIEDWESPEMAVYDDYDESRIQKRYSSSGCNRAFQKS